MSHDFGDWVSCVVGDEPRIIPFDLFLDASDELAAHFRGLGLSGHKLDVAIAAALPGLLAEKLGGVPCSTRQ